MITQRTVAYKFTGADGSATAGGTMTFGRPGILKAIQVVTTGQPAGMDGTVKDETGNTLITFTDTGNTTVRGSVVLDGVSDEGVALVDLAQGGLFRSGLVFAFTSGDADIGSLTDDGPAIVTVWVEV